MRFIVGCLVLVAVTWAFPVWAPVLVAFWIAGEGLAFLGRIQP